jgi:DNA-binding response OmpR family regulator
MTRPAPTAPAGLPPGDARGTDPPALLIVEDDPDVAEVLRDVLAGEGYEVTVAPDVSTARDFLDRRPYDAILSDVRMPDLDGRDLHRWLGAERPALLTRLVFLTGDADSDWVRDFLQQAGRPWLRKPFSLDRLRAVVAAVADRSGRRNAAPVAAAGPPRAGGGTAARPLSGAGAGGEHP